LLSRYNEAATATGTGNSLNSGTVAICCRALTVYLFPSATFHDVRVACQLAAADL
jgi:hypothetical protein